MLNKLTSKLKENSEKLVDAVGKSEIASKVTSKVGGIVEPAKSEGTTKELSLGTIKRQINTLVKEKAKLYEFIGMEVYDLYVNESVEIPQIEAFYKKLDGIQTELNKLNGLKEEKLRNTSEVSCGCGQQNPSESKFCSSCGSKLEESSVACNCGYSVASGVRFCPNCGQDTSVVTGNTEEIVSSKIECVCGALVEVDQLMCMECGRRVMQNS